MIGEMIERALDRVRSWDRRAVDPAGRDIGEAVESIERSILEIRRDLGLADGGDVIIEVADAEERGQWSRAAYLRSSMVSAYRRTDGGGRLGETTAATRPEWPLGGRG